MHQKNWILRPYRCSRGGRTIFRKIHSFVSNQADFKVDLHTQNVDICALAQTWLKEDDAITPIEMCPAGYASLCQYHELTDQEEGWH